MRKEKKKFIYIILTFIYSYHIDIIFHVVSYFYYFFISYNYIVFKDIIIWYISNWKLDSPGEVRAWTTNLRNTINKFAKVLILLLPRDGLRVGIVAPLKSYKLNITSGKISKILIVQYFVPLKFKKKKE